MITLKSLRDAFLSALRDAKRPIPGKIGDSGGWAQRGVLCAGSPVYGTFAHGASGNPRNIAPNVVMDANFENADIRTVMITPYAASNANIDPGQASPYSAIATITWTVNGTNQQVIVDVGLGVQCSAPAEAVKVVVVDATPEAQQDSGTYSILITCTPQTRPTTFSGPVASEAGPVIAATATETILIPAGRGVVTATIFLAPVTGGAAVSATIQQASQGLVLIAGPSCLYPGPFPITLANGMNEIQITNHGGGDLNSYIVYGVVG